MNVLVLRHCHNTYYASASNLMQYMHTYQKGECFNKPVLLAMSPYTKLFQTINVS